MHYYRNLFGPVLAAAMAVSGACYAQQQPEIIFGSGFEDSNTVEWVQQHNSELSGNTVFIDNVLVTASLSPNQSLFVQESVDVSGPNYPQYAGVRIFNPGFVYIVGECVSILGTVSNFQGGPQISPIVAVYTGNIGCGTPIQPYDISDLDDIATDVDPVTSGDQPGALATRFNGALVRISSVTAQTASVSGGFRVAKTSLPVSTLIINPQFYQYDTTIGQAFSSITGILDYKNNQYCLSPRSASDINL